MTMREQAPVIGVFMELAGAENALRELQSQGFSQNQLGLITRDTGADSNVANGLRALALPTDETDYYQREFEAGRVLVTVKAPERREEAASLLARNGAYNATVRQPTTSQRAYDPIAGRSAEGNQGAPVNSSGYGMKRDPSVETDASAGTYDTQTRPESPVEAGAERSFFGQPGEPDFVEPGSPLDPNVRSPRIQ